MYEPAQDVASSDTQQIRERSWRTRRRVRRSEVEAAVRPPRVVVGDVLAEHPFEMTSTEDERPVQALGSDGVHLSLGEGVRPRSPERGENDPHSLAREDAIEAPRVHGVPIPEEEAKRPVSGQVPSEVPSLLGDPGGVGMPRR